MVTRIPTTQADRPTQTRFKHRKNGSFSSRANLNWASIGDIANESDIGKVIGRNGRTARALRTVVSALAGRTVRVYLIDTDEVR